MCLELENRIRNTNESELWGCWNNQSVQILELTNKRHEQYDKQNAKNDEDVYKTDDISCMLTF